MELLNNLALGFQTAGTIDNLLYCLIGVILGTLIGVLPGIGPLATIAMLLPATYKMSDPTTALIMLAGIYYGAQYGGSTTAILVNLPGESSSVVTTLDGYQMARKGRAGPALAIAAIGSFIAGTVATFLLAAFAPPLAEIAFKFGPAEYFALMVLGLIAAVVLAHGVLVERVEPRAAHHGVRAALAPRVRERADRDRVEREYVRRHADRRVRLHAHADLVRVAAHRHRDVPLVPLRDLVDRSELQPHEHRDEHPVQPA